MSVAWTLRALKVSNVLFPSFCYFCFWLTSNLNPNLAVCKKLSTRLSNRFRIHLSLWLGTIQSIVKDHRKFRKIRRIIAQGTFATNSGSAADILIFRVQTPCTCGDFIFHKTANAGFIVTFQGSYWIHCWAPSHRRGRFIDSRSIHGLVDTNGIPSFRTIKVLFTLAIELNEMHLAITNVVVSGRLFDCRIGENCRYSNGYTEFVSR